MFLMLLLLLLLLHNIPDMPSASPADVATMLCAGAMQRASYLT
jgi:hypothetical protein